LAAIFARGARKRMPHRIGFSRRGFCRSQQAAHEALIPPQRCTIRRLVLSHDMTARSSSSTHRTIAALAVCQGLLLTNNSILIATNGLVGLAIAPEQWMATLAVTTYIIGATISTIPISLLMKRIGRRAGFAVGGVFGIAGALICTWAVYAGDFWVLCLGTLVLGGYNAAGQYYRFAAADAASPDAKSTAISLVLAGGIIGGFLGPETSKFTKDLLTPAFLGAYISLSVFCVIAMLVQQLIAVPPLSERERREPGRPLLAILRQPACMVAVLSGMIAYGVMNLLMTATPLAMVACQHPFSDAAFVIQWHVVAMFAPSFVTGNLIKRFGVLTIMMTGVALNLICVAFAVAGESVANFWFAMVLLGIGWNFMFIGATSLLTETHTPSERAKAQGVNDFAIFATMAATSLASGALFNYQGWVTMNLGAVPLLLAVGAAMVWLALHRRAVAKR
jgi:MFS family permease